MNASIHMPITKIILFGPDAFTGTAAPFTIVKAGVPEPLPLQLGIVSS